MKLELADWKEIELQAEQQLRDGMKLVRIGQVVLADAEKMIRAHGGKTNKEFNEEAKKARE